LIKLESITLPQVNWQCAVSCGDHFYVAGFQDRNLCVIQSSWSGQQKMQQRSLSDARPILLAFDLSSGVAGVLHIVGTPRVPMIVFVASDIIERTCIAGSFAWIPDEAVAVDFCANGMKHVLATTDNGLALNTFDANGNPVRSQLITYDSLWPDEGVSAPPVLPVPMCARDTGVYFGLGNRLVSVIGAPAPQVFEMPGVVQSLCGSATYSLPAIVAAFEQGAALFWEDERTGVRFADALSQPLAAFTARGSIVLASSDELHVYKIEGRKIQLAARQRRAIRPIAVLPTAHADGFAIVREDGVVEQFQIRRR